MKVYRIDMMICATAYIRANSDKEAEAKARSLSGESPSILSTDAVLGRRFDDGLDHNGGVAISGLRYSHPDLPDVSLSPAMTIQGVWPDTEIEEAE